MKECKSDLHIKLLNLGGGRMIKQEEKDLFALKWKEMERSFSYYTKCIGSLRMLKLGDTINLGEKENPKNSHRNAKLSDFKNIARIIQSSGESLDNLCSDIHIYKYIYVYKVLLH